MGKRYGMDNGEKGWKGKGPGGEEEGEAKGEVCSQLQLLDPPVMP